MCVFASLIAHRFVTAQGFFSHISNDSVDSLLTNSKAGCSVHDLAVRGGILNYGGYTLTAGENESWSLMFLISEPSTAAVLHRATPGIPLPQTWLAAQHTHIQTHTHALINHKYTQTKGEPILLFISSSFSGPDRLVSVGGGQ